MKKLRDSGSELYFKSIYNIDSRIQNNEHRQKTRLHRTVFVVWTVYRSSVFWSPTSYWLSSSQIHRCRRRLRRLPFQTTAPWPWPPTTKDRDPWRLRTDKNSWWRRTLSGEKRRH